MQSSANVQLSPEEETTMSVSANDLGDSIEGGISVAGMAWLPVCNSYEGIPIPLVQELRPGLF